MCKRALPPPTALVPGSGGSACSAACVTLYSPLGVVQSPLVVQPPSVVVLPGPWGSRWVCTLEHQEPLCPAHGARGVCPLLAAELPAN